MDIEKMLAELRTEHEQLSEAIASLERMAAGQGKRRGRPPAWIVAAKQSVATQVQAPGRRSGRKNLKARD